MKPLAYYPHRPDISNRGDCPWRRYVSAAEQLSLESNLHGQHKRLAGVHFNLEGEVMRKFLMGAGLVIALAAVSRPAAAQTKFGVNAAFGTDTDFGLGARLTFPLGEKLKEKGIDALVSFDYFFPSGDATYWEATANGTYTIKANNASIAPYVGAGLSVAHAGAGGAAGDACSALNLDCSSTRAGLNLLGGIKFKAAERLVPFVEGRFAIRSNSQFVIAGGVYFGKF